VFVFSDDVFIMKWLKIANNMLF